MKFIFVTILQDQNMACKYQIFNKLPMYYFNTLYINGLQLLQMLK